MQVAGARINLPPLQNLLPGPTRATVDKCYPVIYLADFTGYICYTWETKAGMERDREADEKGRGREEIDRHRRKGLQALERRARGREGEMKRHT